MPTYRLDIAYDGTGFHGYARQPGVRTVQGEIEAALATICPGDFETQVAGRTDAGVHARHQVVSFCGEELDPDRAGRSLRRMLAPEISVTRCIQVDEAFNARFSAAWRRYRYFVLNRPVADPLRRHVTWHIPEPLDVVAMASAAAIMVGEHDFASFCRKAEARSTVRTVLDATWEACDEDILQFDIRATAFCHQMVRSIVAFCADVGRGRIDADTTTDILAARDRNEGRGAAPPTGLILWEVCYKDAGLAPNRALR